MTPPPCDPPLEKDMNTKLETTRCGVRSGVAVELIPSCPTHTFAYRPPGEGGGSLSTLKKSVSHSGKKSPFVLGKIKFSALRAHFRYTKTPFSENFQSVTPPPRVGCRPWVYIWYVTGKLLVGNATVWNGVELINHPINGEVHLLHST